MDAVVLSVDGARVARARFEGDASSFDEASESIVSQLIAGGAKDILDEIREDG